MKQILLDHFVKNDKVIPRKCNINSLKKYNVEDYVFDKTQFQSDISIGSRILMIINDITKKGLCKGCKKETNFKPKYKRYNDFCSVKCSSSSQITKEKYKNTCIERFGRDNSTPMNISLETYNLKRDSKYLNELHNTQKKSLKEICQILGISDTRYISKTLESANYNVWRMDRERIKKTRAINSFKKYNVEHPIQKNINYKAMNSLCLSKMHYEDSMEIPEIAKYFNVGKNLIYKLMREYNLKIQKKTRSFDEIKICDYVKFNTNVDVIENDRSILQGKELDIYIPSAKLAIEYNGVYWHSSNNLNDYKYKHLHKTKECEKNNINLFHINSFLWENKKEIVKSVIKSKLGLNKRIYARKCILKTISNKESKEFLNDNHLQGNCGSSVKLGLYFEDELVSIMTFGKPRFNKNYDWELIRFCSKRDITVVGGASKLLTNFRRQYKGSIISYANRRWTYHENNLYKTLGFDELNIAPPNYFYFKKDVLESRNKYQKHKLKNLLDVYNEDLTEKENMINNGYRIYYNTGNITYKMDKE